MTGFGQLLFSQPAVRLRLSFIIVLIFYLKKMFDMIRLESLDESVTSERKISKGT